MYVLVALLPIVNLQITEEERYTTAGHTLPTEEAGNQRRHGGVDQIKEIAEEDCAPIPPECQSVQPPTNGP
jgi:hypothetical protein